MHKKLGFVIKRNIVDAPSPSINVIYNYNLKRKFQ